MFARSLAGRTLRAAGRVPRSVIRTATVASDTPVVRPPPPRLFAFEDIVASVTPEKVIPAVEEAFAKLSRGEVEVPMPMHIGIEETATAGPGDCHIKGGYILGDSTWTVKLANVSFYKNLQKNMPPGSGVFVVCDAVNGAPLGIFMENRHLTDCRTGAAGAISVKYFVAPHHKKVAFIGTGAIATSMARAVACVHGFEQGFAYALDPAQAKDFGDAMHAELGYPFQVCETVEEAVRSADVIFTQTPGSSPVLELDWLKPHATIIASGSDQPTKSEIPDDVMKASKMVCDLVRQCAKVGELRTALESGAMTEDDVYAEIGEVVAGDKPGREGDELILIDLTGTGAQDAAVGTVAWNIMGAK